MINQQTSIFDGTSEDLEAKSLNLIRTFADVSVARNPVGYVVGYSGGKDSDVLVHLFIKSGVKFIIIHNHTTLDAPETVYYIRKKFEEWRAMGIDCRIYKPRKSFEQLCMEKNMLPTRIARFCCAELKERDIPELRFATHVFGVRKAESVKRKLTRDSIELRDVKSVKQTQRFHWDDKEDLLETGTCYTNKYFILNPIVHWTDDYLWAYIEREKIEINPLYSQGFTRVGCVGCPMAGKKRKSEFERYPKFKERWLRISDKLVEKWKQTGGGIIQKPDEIISSGGSMDSITGQALFDWWMSKGSWAEFIKNLKDVT